jgi:flavin-dependent dehydrogenase
MPRPHEAMREFMHSIGFTERYAGVKGHPIPRGGIAREIVADRVLLAGDSAGFVDPFYGEGIAYAIRSGQLAAEVIGECAARGGDYSAGALLAYPRRCRAEFHANLHYSLILSKLMYRFPRVFLRLLVSNRRFLEKYLEIPLHRLSYRGFLSWMVPRLPWYVARSISA